MKNHRKYVLLLTFFALLFLPLFKTGYYTSDPMNLGNCLRAYSFAPSEKIPGRPSSSLAIWTDLAYLSEDNSAVAPYVTISAGDVSEGRRAGAFDPERWVSKYVENNLDDYKPTYTSQVFFNNWNKAPTDLEVTISVVSSNCFDDEISDTFTMRFVEKRKTTISFFTELLLSV